ncbi:MAG TPA: bifunctional UDP-N-acetylglucosamine diphosphorylase/glucosamine-1-phosphate N-acetyltransferase GlmU [Anaeromyxobacteraceae bacterium]|nr:bifunctional UDP-N-acetylglucosamine diphosphorylase/glucosamine-1-phosphate N-acetyltransferase GlmU [Anaeromyxobacteraceae bacterium]
MPTQTRKRKGAAPLAAIVLAAGKGTRMKTERAKVLHPVCGRPMVYYPVKRALEAGASPVVVVVGHQGDAVETALRAALPDAPIRFARQERQLGTAHAVLAAKASLRGHSGPVLILSGDTPLLTTHTLASVVEARTTPGSLAFATMDLENPEGYGRVVHAPGRGPALIVEEKDATPEERQIREVNAGLYVADSGFLWSTLARVDARNAQREFYLTDLVALAADGPGAVAVRVSPVEAQGVNDQEDLSLAIRAMTRRIAASFMAAGVTLEDPERFDADEDVVIGPDTIVEPGVRLRGKTRIGSGCVVGQGCILTDMEIGDGTELLPYCVLERSKVGASCRLGPYARMRPESAVADGVHLGNFVELKKTTMGKGSKANHLTYLGDATIGAGVNVGCGTVTCNYDGEKKHPTRIGDGVFVGSDSILVAPISIGKGAYLAAGSTLTEDVPPGALALGRARQVNKNGWARKRAAAQGSGKGR